MRSVFLFLILSVFTLATLIIQDFLPSPSGLKFTYILLTPIFFTYGALSFPFAAMLILAVFTGFITDLSTLQVINGKLEIGIGWSIVAYSISGVFIQQTWRKAFLQGAWWIYPPLTAACTLFLLTFYYILISLHREGIIFDAVVLWKVIVPTVMNFLYSPLIEFVLVLTERIFFPRQQVSRGF